MHMKCRSVGIAAPMTELRTKLLTLFQTNFNRKQATTSYSMTAHAAGVVRAVCHDRLYY